MEITEKLMQQYVDYLTLKNRSPQTQRNYSSSLRLFRKFIHDGGMNELNTYTQVKSFLLHKIREGNVWATINTHYSALKIFFENICQQQWNHDLLPRPKKEKKLPKILSTQDVSFLIKNATNLRNFTLLSFLYGTGVRLSEAIGVKITDIDSTRMQIRINKGKGSKDRMVDMPISLLQLLRKYYKRYKPHEYLFNGENRNKALSSRTVQYIFCQARHSAGITKPCSVHTLRHCYATHHLESGTDLVYIKNQMGHESIKTTAKYIHLCANSQRKINHPIDSLTLILAQEEV